jgi:hypothetical protein
VKKDPPWKHYEEVGKLDPLIQWHNNKIIEWIKLQDNHQERGQQESVRRALPTTVDRWKEQNLSWGGGNKTRPSKPHRQIESPDTDQAESTDGSGKMCHALSEI